jgi:hypothetical protein
MIFRYEFASAGYMQPDHCHIEHGVSFVRSGKRYTNCPTHRIPAMKVYGTTRNNACCPRHLPAQLTKSGRELFLNVNVKA